MKTFQPFMHLLLDTNVLIPLEPTSTSDVEATTSTAIALTRLAADGGHRISIHPASLLDLQQDKDQARRDLRTQLAAKYPQLDQPPSDEVLPSSIPRAERGSNDWIDNQLLAAVVADAVDYLVTEDAGLHRKAARIGVQDRVLRMADAVATLETLLDRIPAAPPAVEHVRAHALKLTDPIFDSFRADYPATGASLGFDAWISKCRREQRDSWVITGVGDDYGGIALIKPEGPEAVGLSGAKVLKLCSFKVADAHRGRRFGELLLKTIFEYCSANGYTHVYVTMFEHHQELLLLFEDFGFRRSHLTTERHEAVLIKTFVPDAAAGALPALDYHVAFGPPAIRIDASRCFVVPIQPRYHRMLFPDAGPETPLPGIAQQPFGNAIRKAYLCNAPIRAIRGGDAVLFYRSGDLRAVTVAGVVERTVISQDAREIAREVGQRTVYSFEAIEEMCGRGEVLALLFRQDRILRRRIERAELEAEGAINGPPQTISRVRAEGLEWLRRRIEE